MLGLREVIREAQSSLGVFQEQYSVLERRNEELRKEDARLRTEKVPLAASHDCPLSYLSSLVSCFSEKAARQVDCKEESYH